MKYSASMAERKRVLFVREKMPARRPIPERLLARLWGKRATRQAWFRTGAGRRLRVIYPGRASAAAGPDFRDALLAVEGMGLVRGDVEIHVNQRDWERHGHSGDPNYNGVVLHAVLEAESSTTQLRSGGQAPVVSLAPLLEEVDSPENDSNSGLWAVLRLRGYPQPGTPARMGELLDRAGVDRFLARSAHFRKFLLELGPEQTLYEGLMEGLGYRYNQKTFLKLAAAAPYAILERAARREPRERRAAVLESWLIRLSGLSAQISNDLDTPLPRAGFGTPLDGGEWHCFRVRPSNHPRRRIAGAAGLLDRFLEEGLTTGLLRATGDGPRQLTLALMVTGGSGQKPTFIGPGRAADLAVNVVLPFFHGLAGDDESPGEFLDLYQRFGRLQENELTREMAAQLLDPSWRGELNSARRQQGLLHLHSVIIGAR